MGIPAFRIISLKNAITGLISSLERLLFFLAFSIIVANSKPRVEDLSCDGTMNGDGLHSTTTHRNYAVEDTSDGCYRDIVQVLAQKGWRKVSHRKRSKLEKKRLPSKDVPFFIWTINEKDIDFGDVDTQTLQVCNHYEGITNTLTSKQGFCDLLRDMQWSCDDASEMSPRSFNLGDAVQREEFIDDFKMTAAILILKWALRFEVSNARNEQCSSSSSGAASSSSSSGNGSGSHDHMKNNDRVMNNPASMEQDMDFSTHPIDHTLVQRAYQACVFYIRLRSTGECSELEDPNGDGLSMKDKDGSTKVKRKRVTSSLSTHPSDSHLSSNTTLSNPLTSTTTSTQHHPPEAAAYTEIQLPTSSFGLSETEWDDLLAYSYSLAELEGRSVRSKSNTVLWNLLSMKHYRNYNSKATKLVMLLRDVVR